MIKKAKNIITIPCSMRMEGSTLDHCEKCSFFNGVEKKGNKIIGVDCLKGEIGQLNAHVLSFTMGGYLYKARYYDEDIDGPLSEEYEYCEKCCFNKTLKNGHEVCLLRCAVDNDEITNFMCYEGEIWTKEKIEDED